MKILLLGEYSGVYVTLKEGLEILGHQVSLYSDGDYWKKIPGGTRIHPKTVKNTRYHKIINNIIYPFITKSQYYGYEIVQIINPNVFWIPITKIILQYIKKHSGKIFMSAAGDDYYVYLAWKNREYRYFVYDEEAYRQNMYEKNKYKHLYIHSEKRMPKLVDGIIPNSYEYAHAYQNIPNRRRTIPFPINTDKIQYHENIVSDKIIFFHGLNREAAKGTKYIREAMRIIQEKYPDEVECIIDGKLPYEEYLKLLSRTNVVIDQCLSYGYGMNACIAMAQGKVVMSGFEPETLEELELETCPGINILPNIDDIVSKMEWIVQHKDEIPRIGYESRQHIEKYHHYVKIAQKYVDTWMSD